MLSYVIMTLQRFFGPEQAERRPGYAESCDDSRRISAQLVPAYLLLLSVLLANVGQASDGTSVAEAVRRIDGLIADRWNRDDVTPAATSGDAEFCRRVWFDLAGVAPPVAEVRSFLVDVDSDKRAELIDRLLQSPEYANHMATRWSDTLLPDDLGPQSRGNVLALNRWLRNQFIDNVPYDHLVGRFLTAGGDGNSGPAIFYTAHTLAPEKIAAATSRIFMGLQLQCAQCHDHPFDRWTQDEFWSYAAFFGQLESREDRRRRSTLVVDRPGGEVKFPDTDRVMQPLYPGIQQLPEEDPTDNRRRQLTIWLASRDNPYFSRAAVNRVWGHLFARGLVDPVDAMDADNPASHPELLSFLADYFVEIRFDLKKLYATLTRTKVYQVSSEPPSEIPPAETFAVMKTKTLSPQQYYDSLAANVLRQTTATTTDNPMVANPQREQFLQRMRTNSDSPGSYPHGIVQALGLLNGPEIVLATAGQGGLLVAMDAPFLNDRDRIETLYLATLSRMPRKNELERCQTMLESSKEDDQWRQVFGDILWALLNTAECAMCP